jgi:hypothetical protein
MAKSINKFRTDNVQYNLTCESTSSNGSGSNAMLENGLITVDIDGALTKTTVSGIKGMVRIIDASFVCTQGVSSTDEFKVFAGGAATYMALHFDPDKIISNTIVRPTAVNAENLVLTDGSFSVSGANAKSASLQGRLNLWVQPV